MLYTRFLSLFVSLSLFIAPLPLLAIAEEITSQIAQFEADIIEQNPDVSYIDLDKEQSNIAEIISVLSNLDKQNDSILHELNEHIRNGFSFAEYDAVVETLEYAEKFLQKNYAQLDSAYAEKIAVDLNEVISQVIDGSLMRRPTFTINDNINVLGKSTFQKHVRTKQGIHIGGKLIVGKEAQFDSNVTIDGTLSVADVVIVDCLGNLCVDSLSVTDLAVANCINSLCVNNFSAVDASVSGTLSAQDVFIDNATINNLTVTASILDAVINNLTVNFTLSTTDEIINGSLTIPGFTPAGVVHNNASGLLSSSLIVDADITAATITGASIANATIANSNLATINSANVAGNIVVRDGSGNFSAGTITAALNGNATTATTATTAITATNFSGSLAGDVTGTQSATVVATVGGQTAANVAAATVLANAATSANTINTIVKRDGSGDFSAGTITASLNGNATTATTATNFSGSLAGDVTGTQGATVVVTVGGQTAANVAAATVLANAATSNNTINTIVKRDGTGGFSAGTITASLNGNATTATTATTATNFSGSLAGDVTGTQSATVVATVGGQTAANVAAATVLANAATSANTINTIVKRDGSGNFSTNEITIIGTVTNPTDAATKAYVDSAVSTGLVAKSPAIVVSTTNVALSGLQTIDGVTLVANNRVLLVGQTNQVQNGLWLAAAGAWTRPADFATGTQAGSAYVLILSGTVNAGSSWLCNTPLAIIDVNPITFAEFSIPSTTTGANVGAGAGQIFRDKTGVTLNFKTIAAGTHMVVTNNTNDVTLSTDATSADTASTIVARDGTGSFTAQIVSLDGNLNFNNNPSTSTAGNITKSGQIFLHNFNDSLGLGVNAGNFNWGSHNVAIGDSAQTVATPFMTNNTSVGYSSLINLSSGSNNVALGFEAGLNNSSGNNNIYIGNLGGGAESNTMYIGNGQTKCSISGIYGQTISGGSAVSVNSSGQLGSPTSSQRFKHDIAPMNNDSASIYQLNPVTFVYNNDETNAKQYGLIAEEVDQVFPGIVVYDEDGQPYTVQYHVLPVLLLNEMQKQQIVINQLLKNMEMNNQRIQNLEDSYSAA